MAVTVQDVLAFSHGSTEYVNVSGIYPEILEDRHIKLVMPLGKMHTNHVGIAYAGSIFVLLEVAGGSLISRTFDMTRIAPIVKGCEVKFIRPSNTDISVEASISKEEADEIWNRLENNGLRGDIVLNLEAKDAEGNVITKAKMNYFGIPFTTDFMKK